MQARVEFLISLLENLHAALTRMEIIILEVFYFGVFIH